MTIDSALHEQAAAFAQTLTHRVRRVLPDEQPEFNAQLLPGHRPSLVVAPVLPGVADRVPVPLTLTIEGRQRSRTLHLRVMFWCCYDVTGQYLTIEQSEFSLGLLNVPDPLFRYEYDRNIRRASRLPAAHLQVHAHRDEATVMMHDFKGGPAEGGRFAAVLAGRIGRVETARTTTPVARARTGGRGASPELWRRSGYTTSAGTRWDAGDPATRRDR